jgi:hypothetical protein
MAGRNAYRDGRIVEAVQHYKAALEQDSTFAYAALGYLEATLWPSAALEFNPARKWMHSLRDRLTPRDRTYMRALAGPDYPAASTSAETDEAIAEARFALPYRPEVRFLEARWTRRRLAYAARWSWTPDSRSRCTISSCWRSSGGTSRRPAGWPSSMSERFHGPITCAR